MVKFQKCTSLGQICVLNASPACSLLSWQFQLDEHRQLQLHTCETEPATSSIPTLSRFSSSDHGTSLWSERNCWHHPGTSFLYINNFTSWIFLQYIYYVSTLLPSPLSNHHDFLTRLFLPPLGWSCCSLFFPFSQFQHQHEPLRTQPIAKHSNGFLMLLESRTQLWIWPPKACVGLTPVSLFHLLSHHSTPSCPFGGAA